MTNLTINISKWYHAVIALVPLIAMISTTAMWVDTRYIHKTISDNRFIELQIKIIEGQIKDYNRLIDAGVNPTAEEITRYNLDLEQLKNLINERNKILGIGDLE